MKREDFRNFLLNLDKPFIIKLQTATKLRLNKTHRETGEANPYFDRVIKTATRVGKVGVNYASAVTNQRGREAEVGKTIDAFHAELLWKGAGEHLRGAVVRHKKTLKEYVAILPNSNNENEVIVKEKELLYNSKEITEDILKPYLPPPRDNSNNAETSQETERKVFWQTIELDNIVSIIYKGELIKIED